jgi:hypothetical protein
MASFVSRPRELGIEALRAVRIPGTSLCKTATPRLFKVDPNVLNMLHASGSYLELDDVALKEFLPDIQRQRAWRHHKARVFLDYWNEDTDEEIKYCVLSALAAEMVDTNRAGGWVPKERSFIPNGIFLYPELRKIALSKNVNLLEAIWLP